MARLVNPNGTPAAQRLLDYLTALPPGSILTGQHNFPATISRYYDRVYELTGKYPAVWGQDFGFAAAGDKDSIQAREQIIDEAIRQHERGAIITLMWHAVRPTDDEPGTFTGNVLTKISAKTYAELVTPGSEVHRRWLAQTDLIAAYLKRLQAAGVPVLWRPYHEMNGAWFWWGARRGSRFVDLWKQHYQRLTAHHGLHNLVWVWNTNAPNHFRVRKYADLYPGADTVDILATDIYGGSYQQRFHDDLLKLANGKPISIGECGELPAPDVLERQPHWRWFMTWTDLLEEKNDLARIRALYHSPRAIDRDDTRGWKAWRAAN